MSYTDQAYHYEPWQVISDGFLYDTLGVQYIYLHCTSHCPKNMHVKTIDDLSQFVSICIVLWWTGVHYLLPNDNWDRPQHPHDPELD